MAGEALAEAFGEAFVRSPPKDLLPLALAAALAGSEENRGEARATGAIWGAYERAATEDSILLVWLLAKELGVGLAIKRVSGQIKS